MSLILFILLGAFSSTPSSATSSTSLLYNVLKPFKIFTSKETLETERYQTVCESKGGTYVHNECLEFFPERQDFVSARSTCKKKGGDLWVPPDQDLDDPFFLQKLFISFPRLFYTIQNKFWVGFFRTGDRFSTVAGDDIADTSLMRIRDSFGGECVTLTYKNGPLIASPENCEAHPSNSNVEYEFAFVCEYPNELFAAPKAEKGFFKFWNF